jgi:DNA repair protein RadC
MNDNKNEMIEDYNEALSFLILNHLYPCFSKKNKLYFINSNKITLNTSKIENIKDILNLTNPEECKKIRDIIKNKLSETRTTQPIKRWIKEERPREMLIKYGSGMLPLSKLIAIILSTGGEGVSAQELAIRLLNKFRTLRDLESATVSEICSIRGIGKAKASQIKASLELGKRLIREEAEKGKKISNINDVLMYVKEYYSPYLRYSQKELFNVILLDVRNKVIDNIELSVGNSTATIVDPKEIIKEATKRSASGIILVHNHPSGETEPSEADMDTTRKVAEACNYIGVKIIDHVIIGKNENDFLSFAEKGYL